MSQKYGVGYGFLLANEYVDIAYIKSTATELFFPNQRKSYYDVDINECEVQLTDSTGNILYYILSAKITEGKVFLIMMMYIPFSVTNLK